MDAMLQLYTLLVFIGTISHLILDYSVVIANSMIHSSCNNHT